MKTFFNYIISISIFVIIGIFLFDFIILPLITRSQNNVYLPDVKNTSILYAEKKLHDMGFNIEIITASYFNNIIPNTVITMSPRAFTKVKIGRLIKLTISGEKELIDLQNFTGMSITNAKLTLKRQGIILDTVIYEYNQDIKKNHITTQYPDQGKTLLSYDKVSFVVSLGSPPNHYTVPNLINMNLIRAKEIISRSGLILGEVIFEITKDYLDDTVLEQNLTAGLKLSFPEYINLIVSKDERE